MQPQPLAQLSKNLPETLASGEVTDYLKEKYSLKEFPIETSNVSFFDSFDWRLYQKKILCFLEGGALHLTDFLDQETVSPLPFQVDPPGFWRQFPESSLKQALSGILEMRTLLQQAAFSKTTTELRILNKEEKTVAVILLTELFPDTAKNKESDPIRSVQLSEIRGYQKWFLKLSRDLKQFGSPQPCTNKYTLQTVLASADRIPQDYSSGLSINLKADMESRTAAKIIYRDLLSTMLQNEQGIIDDLDIEFLHDFRVAIRRTRSALDLIKDGLEPEISERFKEDFRFLGNITGPVRDLDVYLLMETEYKAGLPEHLQKGLDYFFTDLSNKRVKEQKKLVQELTSPRYTTIIKDWRKYLEPELKKAVQENKKEEEEEPLPLLPETLPETIAIKTTADKIIRKRYKRILRDGQKIHADSPDEDLHRLRIQGKKLRYCLEFFSSLYSKKEMKQLIKQLKLLQNNLGLFNDLSVQQEMLNSYLAVLHLDSKKAKKTRAAIGGLLTNLYREQQQVRTEFEAAFSKFSSKENTELYRCLFKPKSRQ